MLNKFEGIPVEWVHDLLVAGSGGAADRPVSHIGVLLGLWVMMEALVGGLGLAHGLCPKVLVCQDEVGLFHVDVELGAI